MLLDISGEGDEIVIFYTKNSPHMAYSSVIKLLQNSSRTIQFEECYEGNNALDFQLISYLGYLMAGEDPADAEFVIMSNDTGYDPAIRFWKKKGFSIKRFNINYCKMAVQRQKQVSAEPISKAELAEDSTGAEDAAVTEEAKPADQAADEKAAPLAEGRTPAEQASLAEQAAVVEEAEAAEKAATAENPAVAEKTAAESPAAAEKAEPAADTGAQGASAAAAGKDLEPTYSVALVTPPAGKAPVAVVKSPVEKDSVAAVQTPAGKTSPTGEPPAPSKTYPFNKGEVDSFLNCLGKDNLVLLHETLVHVYGMEQGQAIYKTIKEKTYTYQREENLSRKDKVMRFTDMIFARSNLDAPGNFVDFLEKNKDKTRNLNSIRSAITKTFGNGNGMKYYSLFKPYFKIISALK